MITDPARELAIRIEAQEDLYFFSRYMFKERRKYKWMHNWHHRVVCDALMKVFRGETKRLIINIPPRYSKTELAVINFMAWCFGKVPDCEFIHISYSATLAANNAFQTRNLVQETAYKRVFPEFQLRDDSKAKDDWRKVVALDAPMLLAGQSNLMIQIENAKGLSIDLEKLNAGQGVLFEMGLSFEVVSVELSEGKMIYVLRALVN